jgi:hypothetical protein
MGEEQEMKSLKLQNRRKDIFYPADWIAGVDYDEDINENDDDYEPEPEDNNEDDNEIADDEAYDRVDQAELDELLA